MRELLDGLVDSGVVPGVVAVLARHGEVHIEATGTLAFDGAGSGTPMAADTICRLGSMTKPIVAACAMTLVEDCTLRLDDPVNDLLPELAEMAVLADPNGPLQDTVAAKRAITLRDLRRESIARLATAYERDNSATGEPVIQDAPDGRWSRPPTFESGGSGLVSTADDYLAFASALLSVGTHPGDRVLSRPSVTLMTSDHLTATQKSASGFWPGYFDSMGWGFGMSVRTRRTHLGPSVGSYGWPGFYGCATWCFSVDGQQDHQGGTQRRAVPRCCPRRRHRPQGHPTAADLPHSPARSSARPTARPRRTIAGRHPITPCRSPRGSAQP